MATGWVFDLLLALALPLLAWRILGSRSLYRAVILFISFGLLVAVSWVRLDAPDIALAEAAIGAGLVGVLFLNTLGALAESDRTGGEEAHRREPGDLVDRAPRATRARLAIALPVLGLGIALAWAVTSLPEPPIDLATQVDENLAESGVTNPVTAVLLNFRSYDTLLEVGVLLLAVVAAWSLGLSRYRRGREAIAPVAPVLNGLVRVLAPVMVLTSFYLLWAGTKQPGGAFQAGAVLGSLGVLLLLAGLIHPHLDRSRALRVGLTAGFGVFLAVGCAGLLFGRLLEYPPGWNYPLILLIETALTASITLTLALLLVAAPPRSPEESTGEEDAEEGT
jgi:multisubunit Na+/H+ antiporter MnhB subunit